MKSFTPVQFTSWQSHGLWLALVLLLLTGCPARPAPTPSSTSESATVTTETAQVGPLRVLIWDDPGLAEVLQREWQARLEGEATFVNDASSAWLSGDQNRLDADVIIFSPSLLGQLVERRLLRSLPDTLIDAPGYQKSMIFDLIRRREMRWGGTFYSVPMGSAPFMLLTRTDMNSAAGTPLTWGALSQSVQDAAVTHPALTPLLQPLADGWASKLLLARAAPYFYDRSSVSTVFDFRTLRPRITAPPFVRALEELVADQRGDARRLTPQEVMEEFLAGTAVTAITWPSAANGLDENGRQPSVEFPVTIAQLPGSEVRYDYGEESWVTREGVTQVTLLSAAGRCGAISRTGRHVELATRFLGWVSGPEFSGMLSSRSSHTAPFRKTHQPASGDWTDARMAHDAAADYQIAIAEAMNRPEGVLCLRVPQQHRYLEALDAAVANALDGSSSPQAALWQAAATWESITNEIGRESQLKAYQRSLGVD